MEMYRVLGFPGCIGSADCTHVRMQRCPKSLRFLCTGKEQYPSIAFFVVCDHFRRVLYVGGGSFGASSDKTIANNDPLMLQFLQGDFKDLEYVLYDENGAPTLCKGPYLITDNGFPSWMFLQPPDKNCTTRKQRQLFEISDITARAARELAKCLYVKNSDHVGSRGEDIGKGLFSSITYGGLEEVVNFLGELIDNAERIRRDNEGHGGYFIRINADKYLDSYRLKETCKASMANDYRGIFHRLTRKPGMPNLRLIINPRLGTARLETTRVIPAHTEMLWDYGDRYDFEFV